MKPGVLFVDDEPHILEGLRHRLHRHRRRWDMFFADGGKKALETLDRHPIDIIVTDMQMPLMDGATLLRSVRERYPHVVRIVLSGQAYSATAPRDIPAAHQFLTKPCDTGVIENVIERACNLQSLVSDEVVIRTVGKIDKLPSLPRVYSELISALSNDITSMDAVADIIKQDMAICAKTLQLANSAFFRLPRRIGKIEEAVQYLGFNTIKHIALAVAVFQEGAGDDNLPAMLSLDALQKHALLVGQISANFFSDRQSREDAFAVGLLHDIGKLILATELPEHFERVLQETEQCSDSMHTIEMKLWGVTHAEVGGYLLGLWGLPLPIVEAVANHHAPSRVETTDFGIFAAVHIADAFVHDELDRQESASPVATLDVAFVERLGISNKIDAWRLDVRNQLRAIR